MTGPPGDDNPLLRLMLDARLTRCEFIYLTCVCRFGRSAVEGFCRGRIYDPSLQVPVTEPGPYAQTHAVFMRLADGKLYRVAVNLMRRADRHLYDGARIEEGGTLPHGWTGTNPQLLDMLKAREGLDLILNNDPYRSCAIAMQDARHFINGVWRSTAKSKMSFLTSYRIPAFLAPLKWGPWEMIAEIYDQAKQGSLSMQGVVNLQFGRPYTPEVISLTEEMLKKHMVDFVEGTVPKGCSVVTISIDVQKKYVAWEAKAWGQGMVSWSFAAGEIAGTVDSPEVQEQIRALIMRKWPTEWGGDVQARLSLIDSGDQTATVYALCNQFPQPTILSNRVEVPRIGCLIPTKGHNAYDPERLVMSASRARIGDVRYGGVYLWRLGGPIAKMDLFRNLARNPEDSHIGRVVYPATREMKWMRQLLAEKPERATNSTGKPIVKWRKKDREANESLDLHVMNAAGVDILGLASWAPENWQSAERAMKRPDKVNAGKKGMVKPKEKGNAAKTARKSKMVKPQSKR